MWSDWLVFCDCGFQSVCFLMEKDKRLMEACWWERLTEGETGSFSHGWGHTQFSSVQLLSRVQLFTTPWTAAFQASLSITNSWSLRKLMSIESVMPSNHLILCWTLLLTPSVFPSIRVFSNESALHIRWPKYQSLNFNINPSNEHSGLISFRVDWLDLLAVQGTLKSLLQHHSSKATILWRSAFFIVQLSHPYMTTGKTIALIRWTIVGKVRSVLFNKLSRLVIAFLLRSKHLLISWLQSPSAVILEPKKIKVLTVSTVSPSLCHEVMGPDAMILEKNWVEKIVNLEKIVSKRVWNAILGCNLKKTENLCSFPRQTIQYHSNASLCPNQ